MESTKTIFVTGVTGNQGSSVAKNLLEKGYTVIGLTRDPDSEKSQALKNAGAELIKGDLNSPETYKDRLRDVQGVFSMQTYAHGIDKELVQGIQLANHAKESGVKHFLYTSISGCDLQTGIPHWEIKHQIENHIKAIGLPYTIIRPVSFYQNFLFPQVSSRINKGKLVTPTVANRTMQFISTDDIGPISVKIFEQPENYLGKTITIGAEQMDMKQVADVFSTVLGRKITYQKLPGFITRLAMGKNLHKMFNWCNKNDCIFIKDLDAIKSEFPGMTRMDHWIKQHFN
jgi:uncharacterized protein YbjT (DUF2867 family)